MSEINPKRLLYDLRHLRTIGKYGTGVVRPAFSTKDIKARQWLLDRMNKAGLNASFVRGCRALATATAESLHQANPV